MNQDNRSISKTKRYQDYSNKFRKWSFTYDL